MLAMCRRGVPWCSRSSIADVFWEEQAPPLPKSRSRSEHIAFAKQIYHSPKVNNTRPRRISLRVAHNPSPQGSLREVAKRREGLE